MSDNPADEMLPIARDVARLGIGVSSVRSVYRRAQSDPDFPVLWLVKGKNFVRRGDLELYKRKLAERAARNGGRANGSS